MGVFALYEKDITDNKELEDLLQKVNELARIGGWEMDLQNNTLFWSDITKEIIEVSPDFIPGIEMAIAFYLKKPIKINAYGKKNSTIVNCFIGGGNITLAGPE